MANSIIRDPIERRFVVVWKRNKMMKVSLKELDWSSVYFYVTFSSINGRCLGCQLQRFLRPKLETWLRPIVRASNTNLDWFHLANLMKAKMILKEPYYKHISLKNDQVSGALNVSEKLDQWHWTVLTNQLSERRFEHTKTFPFYSRCGV